MSVTHPTTAAGPNDGTKQVSSNAWNEAHTGTIDDTMHGSRGSALHSDSHPQSHAHASHTGIGTNDHHAQAHHAAHEPSGADSMAVDAAAATGSLRTLGSGAAQAVSGTDSRLSDARTPTAHESTHEANGTDPLFSPNTISGTVTIPTDHSYLVTRRLVITGRLVVSGTARVAVLG